jgi:uncharacterized cofD-like protein
MSTSDGYFFSMEELRSPTRPHRVVTVGGGTGTFVVLSGLRAIPNLSLTAVVSSADDGGSTGHLRDAYGILPPGDERQALVALAEPDTMLRALFTHRFTKGDIKGHSLGNLFLAALSALLGSDTAAIEEASRILRIRGKVVSITERPTRLVATLEDGTVVNGEHRIDERVPFRPAIAKLALADKGWISPSARTAITEADMLVFGPGDLYTSTLAPLVVPGARRAIAESGASIAYVVNLFTKVGQTDGYGAARHVAELERYVGRPVDAILVHSNGVSPEAVERYASQGEVLVEDDLGDDPRVARLPLASVTAVPPVPEDPIQRSLIRHDPEKLAAALVRLLDGRFAQRTPPRRAHPKAQAKEL